MKNLYLDYYNQKVMNIYVYSCICMCTTHTWIHFTAHVFEIGNSTGFMISSHSDSGLGGICLGDLFMLPQLMLKCQRSSCPPQGARTCLPPRPSVRSSALQHSCLTHTNWWLMWSQRQIQVFVALKSSYSFFNMCFEREWNLVRVFI